MKYFIDTEFIEGFHKPLFGKRRHHIDLISVGLVAEDGKQFYHLSCEYNYNIANQWVKENVITPLYMTTVNGDQRNRLSVVNFHKSYGITNKQIAYEIREFIDTSPKDELIEFYGYYSDYDWVVFCSLFGRMLDLPNGYPMYCNDLKQTMDEIALRKHAFVYRHFYPHTYSLQDGLKFMKSLPDYPKQINEHSALDDAKWNLKLFKFLEKMS